MQWINNGFKTVHEAVNAKTGRADEFLHPPAKTWHIQNLNVLGSWIKDYISDGADFTIIGDYDCDGVCATAGLHLLLRELGANNIRDRLPRRMSEGYGLSVKIVDEIDHGVVITVDNGIAANEAIREAKRKGLCVLVMDHHLPRMTDGKIDLPEADLIVDPHIPDRLIQKGALTPSDFDGYCGAGLVYKLAQLLIPGTSTCRQIAALSAIATVADVVPLIEDNRNIYHDGIRSILTKEVTPGLQGILDLLNSDNNISEGDIGFKIAPMLNAPGRLYDSGAEISLQALLASGPSKARIMAEHLSQINEARKGLKESAVQRALAIIEREGLKGRNPIVICDPETSEGIVGLVAGAICEEFNVSAIVFTENEAGLKGSARAADYDNIKDSLDRFHDENPGILTKYGGHKAAAGLSIDKRFFREFSDGMDRIMSPAQPAPDEVRYDIEIPVRDIIGTTREISMYGPFGQDNPPIMVKINGFRAMPKDNAFFKEMKKDSVKLFGNECEAVGFSLMDKFMQEGQPTYMDLVGKLGFHYFNGRCTAQVEVVDLKARQTHREPNKINVSIAEKLRQYGLAF